MNRSILTVAFAITALALSASDASAFFRKKKACCAAPVVTYSAPVSHSAPCCGSGNSSYGSSSYGMPYQSNMGYGQPYQNNMGYSTMNTNGVLGAASNLGTQVIDTTGRVVTMPFRALR